MVKIGLISDTHGKLPDEVFEIFKNADLIIHAGDVGQNNVLSRLKTLGHVFAVRGNMDTGSLHTLPDIIKHTAGEKKILTTHILGSPETPVSKIEKEIRTFNPDIVVFGHTHRPYYRKIGDIIYFNPGSASSGRRGSERTVGLITIKEGEISCGHRAIS